MMCERRENRHYVKSSQAGEADQKEAIQVEVSGFSIDIHRVDDSPGFYAKPVYIMAGKPSKDFFVPGRYPVDNAKKVKK